MDKFHIYFKLFRWKIHSWGTAFFHLQKEEEADTIIEKLLLDQDSILRYGGCFSLGMAYCGTSSSKAIKKLLHIAVTDFSDDVRRAAVISLGTPIYDLII